MTDDLPYKTWDHSPVCPHCGSDFVEYNEDWDSKNDAFRAWIECLDCGRKSVVVSDPDEVE